MKKILIFATLLVLGLIAGSAGAQNTGFNGLCQQGGVSATVSGLPSTNKLNGVIPSCWVTVYLTGTTTKASIFKTIGGTALPNPFQAAPLGSAAPGQWLFFAATGQGYDVVMQGGILGQTCNSSPQCFTQPVALTDLIVPNGGGGGGGTCGPLTGDSTSTQCGNGNFVSAGTTSNDQAFGFTNMGTLTHPTYSIAFGNNSLVGGTGSNQDVIAGGDFTANNIHGSFDLICFGDSTCENVNLNNTICAGDSACTNTNVSGFVITGHDIEVFGDSALSNIVGNTSMDNIIAAGQSAGSGLNASSGTNTELIFFGDGTGSGGYTDAVNNLVCAGQAACAVQPSLFSPNTFAPSNNVGLGQAAAANNGGSNQVGVGLSAVANFATGSHDNVGIGNSAMTGSIIGVSPRVIPVVHDSVGIGQGAGGRNAGNGILAIGNWTLGQSNCGVNFTGNTGDFNIGEGDHALAANGSGNHNIAIGYFAGSQGWVDCSTPGNSNITGSLNTWVGDNAGPVSTTQLSNTVALGAGAHPTASNQMVLGNSSITQTYIRGIPDGCLSASGGLITGSGVACGSGGASTAFSAITGSTNTTAAMIVGTGASMSTAGSGTIAATSVGGITVSGTPSIGQVLTATSTSAANWQTPASGVSSVTASNATVSISPTTGAVLVSINLTNPNTWTGLQTFSAGISLSGASSPISLTGTAGTAGQCLTSAGAGATPTWGTCGGGGGSGTVTDGAGTTTAGLISESTTTLHGIDYNSLLDNGHTNAGALTYSGANGLFLTGGTAHQITIAEEPTPANPTAGSEKWYANSTTHLMSCITSTGSSCAPSGGGGGTATLVASAEVVSFSATPTFSTAFTMSRIVLTGNITSFTLAAGSDGQLKTLCFAQGSGPYTVTPPTNVHGFFAIGNTNASWNCQSFSYDNTDSIWLATSLGVINE